MMLDITRLRLLRELHARGTIAAVASALSYSPSTVSRQLSELQREAGVTLLERDGRRLRLTGAAHVLLRHAEALLSRLELAEAELAETAGAISGVVRISAFQTASIHMVTPALALLAARYPALRVEVNEAQPEQALEALVLREADLALCDEYDHVPFLHPPEIVSEELHAESVRLAMPSEHPLASTAGPVPLSELANETWAAGAPGNSHGRLVTHVCAKYGGFRPDIRHHTSDLLILKALVRAGQAVTLLPDLALLDHEPGVQMRPTADVPLRRRIHLASRPGSVTWPALAVVRETLHEVAQSKNGLPPPLIAARRQHHRIATTRHSRRRPDDPPGH